MRVASNREARGTFLRFALVSSGLAAGLLLVGSMPSWKLGGEPAVRAMVTALGVALGASLLGAGVLIRGNRSPEPATRAMVSLAATGVRLFLVVTVVLVLSLGKWLEAGPLLIWLALSYPLFLVLDTRFAIRLTR